MTSSKSFFQRMDGPICRDGNNGAHHPSQIVGLQLVEKEESLLDVGCGSGTTAQCIRDCFFQKNIKYKGVDFIPNRIKWCDKWVPGFNYEVQDATALKEKDDSWDVVWSRHVLEHLPTFEDPLKEWMRVARKKVICILFNGWNMSKDHEIGHIKWSDDGGPKYECEEYFNLYNKEKALEFLKTLKPEWKYKLIEDIGDRGKVIPNIQKFPAKDIIIYLEKR